MREEEELPKIAGKRIYRKENIPERGHTGKRTYREEDMLARGHTGKRTYWQEDRG